MNVCIMDVFNLLNEEGNYVFPIKDYKRIGRKVEDNFNMFEKVERSLTPFKLVVNKERLNLSIQNKFQGHVKLNPISAKKVDLPKKIQSNIFRNKTIVKDGELNIEELEMIINTKTYLQLKRLGINMVEMKNDTQYEGYHITLNFKGLKLIDNKYKKYTLDSIMESSKEMFILEAKQKVVNTLLKLLPEKDAIPGYNDEQIELLKEYGLDKNLNYKGIDNEVKAIKETYSSKVIEFKVKGCSGLPKLDDVLQRSIDGKKLNLGQQTMFDYYTEIKTNVGSMNNPSIEEMRLFYNMELKSIKKQLFKIKLNNTITKALMVQSPMQEIALDSSGKYQYKDLVIKEKVKEFEI